MGSEPESLRLNIRRMSFPDRAQPEVATRVQSLSCTGEHVQRDPDRADGFRMMKLAASGRRSSRRCACLWGKDELCTHVSNRHSWIAQASRIQYRRRREKRRRDKPFNERGTGTECLGRSGNGTDPVPTLSDRSSGTLSSTSRQMPIQPAPARVFCSCKM